MVKRRSENLPEELYTELMTYMKEHPLTKAEMARLIGFPGSTFRGILKYKKIRKKNLELLKEFFKNPEAKLTVLHLDESLPITKVVGNEQPKISQPRLQALFTQAQIGMDLLIPILAELANSDIGSRRSFHEFFKDDRFQNLYVLARAMTSESMLESVKKELNKTRLP